MLDARAAFALAPQRFALSWVREPGAEACSTGHRLAKLVTSLLGPVLATPDEAQLAIEGSVRGATDGWHARVTISDRSGSVLGRRELQTAASCAALDAQVLLVIAVAIDPEVALDGLSPELIEQLAASGDVAEELLAELRAHAAVRPRPAPAAAPAPQPTARPRRAPTPAPDEEDSYDVLSIRLGPVLSLGRSPSPALGIGFGLELRPLERWALALHGAWFAPSTAEIEGAAVRRAEVRFGLQALTLGVCGSPVSTAAFRLNACAGIAAHRIEPRSAGLVNTSDEARIDSGPLVAATLSYLALRPWSFTASAALDFLLRRPSFSYRSASAPGGRRLFVPSTVGFALWLALGVEI